MSNTVFDKALAALQAVDYVDFNIPDEEEQTKAVIRVVLKELLDYSGPYRYNQVELSVDAVEALLIELGGVLDE